MEWTTIRIPKEMRLKIKKVQENINKCNNIYADAEWKVFDFLLESYLKKHSGKVGESSPLSKSGMSPA